MQGQNVLGHNHNPIYTQYNATGNTYADNANGQAELPFVPFGFTAMLNFSAYLAFTGCLQVCLYDSGFTTNQIQNGSFTADLSFWTVGDHWSWGSSGGKALCAAGIPPDVAGKLSQQVKVPGGGFYELTFTTGGLNIGNRMRVEYSINGLPPVTAGIYPNGINTAILDLTAYPAIVELEVFFCPYAFHDSFNIDDVSLVATSPSTIYASNCLDVQTKHDCTLLFTARNNDDAFGFEYDEYGSFEHLLRVKAKMDVTAYPEETETPYIFSNNNRVLMFARRDKEYTIFITDAPDHIHDCLSHMRLHDNFEIGYMRGGTSPYIKESAYELNRRKTSSLKQATFTVREKQGIASNFPCR